MNISLTRNDTALLKGAAILAIVLHNFCHWVPGAVVENEYNFHAENARRLVDIIVSGGPHVVLNIFSHLGCYGVPVFLFLSGYGVVKKYEQPAAAGQGAVPVWNFARYNALKLWRLMLAGMILLFIYETFFSSGWRHGVMNVIYMLTFVTNFFPQTGDTFLPKQDLLLGPWWYFSLTMQMYMLYRVCYYRRGDVPVAVSVAVCVILQVLSVTVWDSPKQEVLHYLRYTFLACLLPFALGVWAARHTVRISAALYVAAWVVFAGGCFNVFLWILSPVALVVIVMPLVRLARRAVRFPLEWTGGISAALFVVHPVVRCFLNPRTAENIYITISEYLAVSIIAAWALTALLKYIPGPRLR